MILLFYFCKLSPEEEYFGLISPHISFPLFSSNFGLIFILFILVRTLNLHKQPLELTGTGFFSWFYSLQILAILLLFLIFVYLLSLPFLFHVKFH